jgi:glycerol-1-phosphatase
MDGTLVDSTPGVKGAWNLFRETYPTIDINHILSCEHLYLQYTTVLLLDFFDSDTASHGVRTVENLRNHCSIQDPEILKVSVR